MKIATIGTSSITDSFIDAAKQVEGVSITAVYSRTAEGAKEFAAKHEVQSYFTDIAEMAADETIDCVYIASPNSVHFEQAVLFLKNKKHVICEKPIFVNLDEWDKAFQVAEDNGVFLFEAIRNVYLPNFTALKADVEKAGKISAVNFTYADYSSRYDDVLLGEEPNIFSLAYAGGALVDIGVYSVAAVVALFGKPERAEYYPVIIQTGVDGAGTLVLRYADFVCTILTSKIATTGNYSEIQGDRGTFTIDHMGLISEVHFLDKAKASRENVSVKQNNNGMVYEVEAFYKVITSDDREEYERMKQLSYDILSITEAVRQASGIIFHSEQ